MEQKTIKDILEEEGINESKLALKIGVSVSLISKIKSDNYTITKKTQAKFQEIYPNYELVNDKPKWKALYESEKLKNEMLADDYARVSLENEELRKRIDIVIHYLKTGELLADFYKVKL